MDGVFGRRRPKRRPTITTTPLIDVMLLLLIFFMVSATFRTHHGMDVDLPHAKSGEEQKEVQHEVSVSAEGQLYFNGREVDEAGLQAALVTALDADPEAVITLRADESADFGRVVRAMDIARDVGGKRLIIRTRPLK